MCLLTLTSFFFSSIAVDSKDARGETPLHTACYRGDVATARMLLERGRISVRFL